MALSVYCLFTQSAQTATRSHLHSGDSCAAREAKIDTRIPRKPARCHGASKTQVFDKLVLRQKLVKPRPHYPIAQASQAADVTPTPPSRVPYPRVLSVRPLLGPKGQNKTETCQNRGRILSRRDEQTLLQHQCRLVGTCAGRRSLVPALLRWGQLALRIRAPQTVLFQDEHRRPWPRLAQSRASKPALTRSS